MFTPRQRIAVIDKAPSKVRYQDHFKFEYDHYHMSSVPIAKLLKKNVDLEVDLTQYDLVILVGSEAAKEYAKVSSVTNMTGVLIDDKFVCISNPAMLLFRPEVKPDFQQALDKITKYIEGEKSPTVDGDFAGIYNEEDAIKFFQEVLDSNAPLVALDTETTALYPRDGYVLGLSISYKSKHGRYVITDVISHEAEQLLQQILDKYKIVFHNLKFDFKMLKYHMNLKFNRNDVHDTMILHYLLDENDAHGLKPLALKYTDYGDYDSELDTFKKEFCARHGILKDDFTYDLIPVEIISKYASIDTAVTFDLFNKFYPIVMGNPKLKWVYENLMMPGILFLMDMEEVGIPMSVPRLEAADKYLDMQIGLAKEAIYQFDAVKQFEKDTGIIFNPASVMQLRKILFDYLGLSPTGKLTKAGAISTDAEVLEELSDQHPLPKAILKIRKLTKIRNTYITKILPELDNDKRIRTNFNLTFTTSGRLSSSGKFNAQQITRDDPIIKGCIKAPEGYKIVSQDLTTAEMYYAAVLSGDAELMKVFSSGGDFHSTIAKMVFNLPCEVGLVKKLYGDMRQAAKAISFGILYGSGPAKVVESVNKGSPDSNYSIEQARDDIKAYFTRFSKLKRWLDSRKKFIETNGYTYSFFGRKRRLPNVFSADKGIAAHEVRSGINMEVQSLASDMNLLGAIETANTVRAKNLDASIFMLVHDSIVAMVKDEHVEEYCAILKAATQRDRGCSIPMFPIGVDQDIGDDYSFGDFETVYAIESGMLSRIPTDKETA